MFKKRVTVKEIQAIDRMAIETYRIPSLFLMENAGHGVAKEVLKLLKHKENPYVCLFCGTGNNGGDGFVAARHLIEAHVAIKVFLLGNEKNLKEDALANYFVLKKLNCFIKEISTVSASLKKNIERADVVVDAIFGVGLNREITGLVKDVVKIINRSRKYVLSVDVPSGLDATTGKIHGVCVKAQKTITFTFPKKGFFLREGSDYAGKIVVAPIGIPQKIIHGRFS